MDTNTLTPALYLFPVPLSTGPASDVLPALNLELLHTVRHFVVENVRTARRFLRAADPSFDIDACQFTELSEHTAATEVDAMLAPLLAGNSVGVLSEAGCPAVADPGALLVAAAQRRGLRVVPLVGPSSILLALMASGFNGQSFAFVGYLPVEGKTRSQRIKELERLAARHGQTQIFIETPYRNDRLLAELAQTLSPETPLCVATDITGPGQSIRTMAAHRWHGATIGKVPTIFLIGNQQQ